VILWKEDIKLVGRTTPFGMELGLSANPSKLDSVRSNVLQRLPACDLSSRSLYVAYLAQEQHHSSESKPKRW
jgi:hypothetical protein